MENGYRGNNFIRDYAIENTQVGGSAENNSMERKKYVNYDKRVEGINNKDEENNNFSWLKFKICLHYAV